LSETSRIEPLHIEGVVDYHCHCDYSIDAEGTIDEYCQAAIKRNLAEICFTTHFDANPDAEGDIEYIRVRGNNFPVSADSLATYVDDVRTAHERYYVDGLSVKLGLEFGWYKNCEETAQQLKDRYSFDYFLCGIHEIENICFCCNRSYERCFSRFDAQKLAEIYFHDVTTAARTGLFDSIAHLAYYLRSGLEYYGDAIKQAHRPYLSDTLEALIDSGTGLEINTSAIRHGLTDYYPPVAIVNAARKAGVEVNFLGSDAHRPDQIGLDFEAAVALVPDTLRGCEE
jgi:histidinol-phosphatase (PHP family)